MWCHAARPIKKMTIAATATKYELRSARPMLVNLYRMFQPGDDAPSKRSRLFVAARILGNFGFLRVRIERRAVSDFIQDRVSRFFIRFRPAGWLGETHRAEFDRDCCDLIRVSGLFGTASASRRRRFGSVGGRC